jgi:hypothetical protein
MSIASILARSWYHKNRQHFVVKYAIVPPEFSEG